MTTLDTNDAAAPTGAVEPSASNDDLAQFFAQRPPDLSGSQLDDDAQHIGGRLADARAAAGLTQRETADRIGVKESTIVEWETGETSPRGHRLNRLAGMLGVSISWILMGRGIEPTDQADAIAAVRNDLDSVRARLDDVVNELTVLDQRLGSIDHI